MIRSVRLEDLPQIGSLCKRAFDLEYDQVMLRQYFDLFSEMYLVAESEGNIHGYCIGAAKPLSEEGWILDLAVAPNMRSIGIGRNLVNEVLEKLELANVKKLFLTVNPDNTHAIKLYQSMGFKSQQMCSDYFAEGQDKLIMEMTYNNRTQSDAAKLRR